MALVCGVCVVSTGTGTGTDSGTGTSTDSGTVSGTGSSFERPVRFPQRCK